MGFIGTEETQEERVLFPDDEPGKVPETVPQTDPVTAPRTEPLVPA